MKSFLKSKTWQDSSGQVLIEFILLFVVMVSLSFVLMKGVNSRLAIKWEQAIKIITQPSTTDIQLR